ncbi:MAG: hypothetical protein ACPGYV_13765 [Phycisphaeraceae bacterium]
MTKQRKMLIGVMCVGLGGLAVDRLLLGPPENASASDEVLVIEAPAAAEVEDTRASTASADDPEAEVGSLPSYASLTERLIRAQSSESTPSLDEQVASPDPFRVPSQWQTRPSVPRVEAPTQTTAASERLNALLTLDGTVRSLIDGKEELMAVVTGGSYTAQAVRVGQRIRIPMGNGVMADFELIEVGTRYVVWQAVGSKDRVEMRVAKVL